MQTFELCGFVGVSEGQNDWGSEDISETEVHEVIEAPNQSDAIRQANLRIAEFRLRHEKEHGSLKTFRTNLALPPTVPPWRYCYPPKQES